MTDTRAERILHLEKAIQRAAEPLAPVPDVPLDAPEAIDNADATVPASASSEEETPDTSQDAAAAPVHDGEATEASATPDGTDAPARQNKGVGKRINELTREKYEAQREAAAARAELEQLKAQLPRQQASQPAPTEGKPTLESCGWDVGKFEQATTEWAAGQAERATQHRQAMATVQQKVDAYNERKATFAVAHPDYDQTLQAVPIPIPPVLMETIRDSEMGPQVAYHLAQHLDELSTIVKLPPVEAIKRIAKLEDKLSTPHPKPPVSPVTRASAPPVTLQGKGLARKDLTTMTVEDHMAELRAKRQAQR